MAVDPVIRNQVQPVLDEHYQTAVRKGKIKPNKRGFQLCSIPTGHGEERKYWVANDEGVPIESLGSVLATPTVCG